MPDGRMHVSGLLMAKIMLWEPWICFDEVMSSGIPVIADISVVNALFFIRKCFGLRDFTSEGVPERSTFSCLMKWCCNDHKVSDTVGAAENIR